jgi:hypothetical protein
MTITQGPLDINRIKIELGMDSLNAAVAANDINSYWFRRLAQRPGDRQPISMSDFWNKGCRVDGYPNVTNDGGSPNWANTADLWVPFFNGQLRQAQMTYNGTSRRYDGLVSITGEWATGDHRPVWVWNVTTNVAVQLSWANTSVDGVGLWTASNINGAWLRAGAGDRIMVLPVLT